MGAWGLREVPEMERMSEGEQGSQTTMHGGQTDVHTQGRGAEDNKDGPRVPHRSRGPIQGQSHQPALAHRRNISVTFYSLFSLFDSFSRGKGHVSATASNTFLMLVPSADDTSS